MPAPTPNPLALQAIVPGPDGNKIVVFFQCITDGIDAPGPGTVDCTTVDGGVNVVYVTLNVYGWFDTGTGLFHVSVGDWPDVAVLINLAIPDLVLATAVSNPTLYPLAGTGLSGGSSGYGV